MDEISRIAAAAEVVDGVAPLDEATWLALRHRPDTVQTWQDPDGFALLIGHDVSLVVAPPSRGAGVGGRLLDEVLRSAAGSLRAWSHGDHPAAARLADQRGFERVRELWVMRSSLDSGLPDLDVPSDIVVRGYRDADADELLRVNAAAFAHHPEQGAMDAAGLAERMAEDWFDPAGLLVATSGGRLLGFHWTKQHPDDVGEVYVVGIDPTAQGRGLGRLLTLAGLHHLAHRGVRDVLLYVEATNAAAISTYSKLGFHHATEDTHVMYSR